MILLATSHLALDTNLANSMTSTRQCHQNIPLTTTVTYLFHTLNHFLKIHVTAVLLSHLLILFHLTAALLLYLRVWLLLWLFGFLKLGLVHGRLDGVGELACCPVLAWALHVKPTVELLLLLLLVVRWHLLFILLLASLSLLPFYMTYLIFLYTP